MSVGFLLDNQTYYEIGASSFLYSFFSTVAYRLENKKWGSKYPYIMREFYSGILKKENIKYAMKELAAIKNELEKYSPDDVVWDFDNLKKQPPWGKNISKDITSLANYYVTSDGRDFIELFFYVLDEAQILCCDILIE